jgi:hypothetical protein
MTAEQFDDLWFRFSVRQGLAPGLVLAMLRRFRQWRQIPGRPLLPRLTEVREEYVLFELEGGRRGIQCGRCGLASYNPNDVQQRYCGNCRRFLLDPERR